MTTDQYLSTLKNPTRQSMNVSMRQAMAYFLYRNDIPVIIIAKVMRMTRGTIYNGIRRHSDLMECRDKLAECANAEIGNHKISVRPTLVSGDVCTKPVGYVLVIDNVIF